jgi:hypothetical protein
MATTDNVSAMLTTSTSTAYTAALEDASPTSAGACNGMALASATSDSTIVESNSYNASGNAGDGTTLIASKSSCSESSGEITTPFEIDAADIANDNSNADSNGTGSLPQVAHMMTYTLLETAKLSYVICIPVGR